MSSEFSCQFTITCYWFGEILEIKHCEGWWVGHPARSQPLVVLESKNITLFNVLNVLLSRCYLILHSSLKLFGHSSSRIASENWDTFQEVVSTNMPPRSAESVAQAGCWTINYMCPCWGQEVGKGSHLSCWDLWASRAGWPCAGSVLGGGPGIPPHQCLWLKQRYTEDEVGLLTRLFGENTQAFLFSVKLHEEFQVLAGHLGFYRKELFCYINKNYPRKKVKILLLAPCNFIHDGILSSNYFILNERNIF